LIQFHDVYATEGAAGVLYALLKERTHEYESNISHHSLPSWEDHKHFVERRPYWLWYLISNEDQWLGAISVSLRNEIGIGVFRTYRDQGWGKKAVRKLLEEIKAKQEVPGIRRGQLSANINPNNERSIQMFESLGFKLVQQTYVYEP